MEIVPYTEGRPATVHEDGWDVILAIRDVGYLTTKRYWKGRIAETHTDVGGSKTEFLKVQARYRAWREAETEWYARNNLSTPDYRRPKTVIATVRPRPAQVIWNLLVERRLLTRKELMRLSGLSLRAVNYSLVTFAQAGVKLAAVRYEGRYYTILVDARGYQGPEWTSTPLRVLRELEARGEIPREELFATIPRRGTVAKTIAYLRKRFGLTIEHDRTADVYRLNRGNPPSCDISASSSSSSS